MNVKDLNCSAFYFAMACLCLLWFIFIEVHLAVYLSNQTKQTHPQNAITWCVSFQSVYFLVEILHDGTFLRAPTCPM